MYFTKNRLKSPLFAIRHKFCQYSPDECGIKLYLKVDSFPDLRGNYTIENLISSTLMGITEKVKTADVEYLRNGPRWEDMAYNGMDLKKTHS